jgi:hypothetical protein
LLFDVLLHISKLLLTAIYLDVLLRDPWLL